MPEYEVSIAIRERESGKTLVDVTMEGDNAYGLTDSVAMGARAALSSQQHSPKWGPVARGGMTTINVHNSDQTPEGLAELAHSAFLRRDSGNRS